MQSTFNIYLNDLLKENGATFSFETVLFPDAATLLAAFDKGEIDGFAGSPLDYLARKDKIGKAMAAVEYKYATLKQRFLIVARAGDGITQLKDLKNKRLTLDPDMDIEALYLNTNLLRNKLSEIPEFFSERRDAKSPNVALMDVFFNKSDITVVRENEYKIAIELNPQLSKKLIILDKSEPFIVTLGLVSNKISEAEFARVVQSFNNIVTTEKGKKLLDIVLVNRIAVVSPDDLNSLQELLSENIVLKQSKSAAVTGAATVKKLKTKRDVH